MTTIESFKAYMLGSSSPNYVKRYCQQLNAERWKLFHNDFSEPLEFMCDEDYLFFILKWILKYPFEDLSFEVYLQVAMTPDHDIESLIKPEWIDVLDKRYKPVLNELISGLSKECKCC